MTREIFEPGMYDISNERYHAAEGVSRSALWTFKQLPQKYWFEYLSGQYERPSDKESYLIGNMVHTLLLEPQLFDEQYFMMKKVNRTTKQGKLDYEQGLLDANERTLINVEQWDLVNGIVNALQEQEVVRDVIGSALFEKSIFWRDEETGLLCKARPDIWNDPLCGDLKTTEDAGYRAFQMSAMKYGYFLQAAMIYEALKSLQMPFEKFLFMCVEKKKPHAVGLYLIDDEALQFGLDLFHSLLRKFAECQHKNEWPDYGVQMLMIPKYATMELEND